MVLRKRDSLVYNADVVNFGGCCFLGLLFHGSLRILSVWKRRVLRDTGHGMDPEEWTLGKGTTVLKRTALGLGIQLSSLVPAWQGEGHEFETYLSSDIIGHPAKLISKAALHSTGIPQEDAFILYVSPLMQLFLLALYILLSTHNFGFFERFLYLVYLALIFLFRHSASPTDLLSPVTAF